jgi:hypothetical protein
MSLKKRPARASGSTKSNRYIETVKVSMAAAYIASAILAPDRYVITLGCPIDGSTRIEE